MDNSDYIKGLSLESNNSDYDEDSDSEYEMSIDVSSDVVLYKSPEYERPQVTCWAPKDLHSLAGRWERYKEFSCVIRTVHFEDYKRIRSIEKLDPQPLKKSTHLRQTMPDLEVLWFGMPSDGHNWYGNVSFVVDLDLLLQKLSLRTYFIEVVDYRTQSASRLLLTSKTYEHLREFDPQIKGGPWFVDENKKNKYLTLARRCRAAEWNGHTLELMLELTDSEAKEVFAMASVEAADHSEANDEGYMKCRKHRSGRYWTECPTPWSKDVASRKIRKHGLIKRDP